MNGRSRNRQCWPRRLGCTVRGYDVPQVGAGPVRPPGVEAIDGNDAIDHVGEDGDPRSTTDANGHDAPTMVASHRSIETDEPRRRAEGGGSQPEPARRRGECPCRRGELNRGGGRRRHHFSLLRLLWHTPIMTEGCKGRLWPPLSRQRVRLPATLFRPRTSCGTGTTGMPRWVSASASGPRSAPRSSARRHRGCVAASSAAGRW